MKTLIFLFKKFTYYILFAVVWLFSLLPFWLLYMLSDITYVLVYYIFRYRRKVVRRNLTTSFPEKPMAELQIIERQFYQSFCDYFFETFKLLSITDKALLKHIEFVGVEKLEKVFDEGRDCAAILGHYGNWEWLSATGLAFKRYPDAVMGLIYHPLRNDQADWLSVAIRETHGGVCVNKRHVLRHLVEYQQAGRHSLFGYISDQAPKMSNIHLWLNFLNHDTPVFTGGERIMRKMDNAVYYADMERLRRGHYRCTFRLLSAHAAEEEENDITRRFFQMLEHSIRRHPALYLWTHNRWKRSHEEFDQMYEVVDGKLLLRATHTS